MSPSLFNPTLVGINFQLVGQEEDACHPRTNMFTKEVKI
uniref:Uncharacterized protein n=1 Tax=Rhizophora mucronata TaxID=61149 RepID=A0A2P2PT00_RHIMU